MQIDGGRNDKFAAYADSGALVMGHYQADAGKLPLWRIARHYTLADNFFMGAFGGSFLNHFWLICACTPSYPHADRSPAKRLDRRGRARTARSLKLAANSPRSALDGIPKFVRDGSITPDFYAVNTMQPPYQPSANKPAPGGDAALADPARADRRCRRRREHDDRRSALRQRRQLGLVCGGVAGGARRQERTAGAELPIPSSAVQLFRRSWRRARRRAPSICGTAGLTAPRFIKAIDAGTLPQVTFYKPQGNLNEHPGYAAVLAGDAHIADAHRASAEEPAMGPHAGHRHL